MGFQEDVVEFRGGVEEGVAKGGVFGAVLGSGVGDGFVGGPFRHDFSVVGIEVVEKLFHDGEGGCVLGEEGVGVDGFVHGDGGRVEGG